MNCRPVLSVLLTALVMGCSGRGAGEAGTATRTPNLISRVEIERLHARDAYEVVARLRSNWIQPRGPQSFQDPSAGQVSVYVNDVRVGGAEVLRQLHVDGVQSIEYLNEVDAAARFGLTTRGGSAILVRSRPGN